MSNFVYSLAKDITTSSTFLCQKENRSGTAVVFVLGALHDRVQQFIRTVVSVRTRELGAQALDESRKIHLKL